jgi:hypothetical protein
MIKAHARISLALVAALSACTGARGASNNERTNSTSGSQSAIDSADSATPAAVAVADAAAAAAPAVDPALAAVLAAHHAEQPNWRGTARVLFGPIAVDDPTDPGTHAVAIVVGDAPSLVYTAVPFVAGQSAQGSLYGVDAEKITGLSVRRINADQRPDVAVFLRDEVVTESYVGVGVQAQLFTLDTSTERTMVSLYRAQLELAGVRSEAELDAQIPTLGTFEAPTATTSPGRFLARLRYATPEQFVSVVPAAGIRLCQDVPDRSGTRRKTCRSVARNRVASEYTARYNIRRSLGEFADLGLDDHRGLQTPSCQRHAQELQCGANEGGPVGVSWTLTVEAGVLRIAEVSPWHESS